MLFLAAQFELIRVIGFAELKVRVKMSKRPLPKVQLIISD